MSERQSPSKGVVVDAAEVLSNAGFEVSTATVDVSSRKSTETLVHHGQRLPHGWRRHRLLPVRRARSQMSERNAIPSTVAAFGSEKEISNMRTYACKPRPSRIGGALCLSLHLVAFLALVAVSAHAETAFKNDAVSPKPAAVGTEATVGRVDQLTVKVKVEGPSTQPTPLQVACVFEYTEGDILKAPALPAPLNGMLHLDQALHGLITDLRKNGKFAGHALETLLIKPPKGAIKADQLLLVGLGDRKAFTPAIMNRVGAVGMREALRLGVASYSHASDLKDAGMDSPTGEVARAVISGARDALAVQRYISDKGDGPPPSVHALTLLAGPAFFADTTAAARGLMSDQEPR